MRNRSTKPTFVALSQEEKLGTLSKLAEKTEFENSMYRKFLLVVGVAFGLISIWVTWAIERLANYSNFGIMMNMISGLMFLYLAWRNLYHRECKIKATVQKGEY